MEFPVPLAKFAAGLVRKAPLSLEGCGLPGRQEPYARSIRSTAVLEFCVECPYIAQQRALLSLLAENQMSGVIRRIRQDTVLSAAWWIREYMQGKAALQETLLKLAKFNLENMQSHA